jgi:serine protease Do
LVMFNGSTQKHISRYSGSTHFLRACFLAIGGWLVCISIAFGLLLPPPAYAYSQSMPGGNVSDPATRAVNIAKPAIVRILTATNSHLKVHFSSTNDVTFPQQENSSYKLIMSGTGVFISAHGDILTADHVVHPPHQDLDQLLYSRSYSKAAEDVANYMSQNGKSITAEDVEKQLKNGQLQSTSTYETPISQVYLSTDYAGTITAPSLDKLPLGLTAPVDKIKAQSSFDQQDTAIIHVPMDDTPSVKLGNSDNVQQQDHLTVIGYPSVADVSQKPQDFLTSSISEVYVSAKKTSKSGAPLIQIGGNITHGNSGGPAIDAQGKIVGIASFMLSDGSSGSSGTSFFQAGSSAQALIQSIKLDTTPGSFQKQWSKAFEDYSATTPRHWHTAAQELAQLAQDYPQFQAVQPYLDYAQEQVEKESGTPVSTVTPKPTPTQPGGEVGGPDLPSWLAWVVIIVAILVVFALAAGLFMVTLRGQGKKSNATPLTNKEPQNTTNPSEAPKADASSSPGHQPTPPQAGTSELKAWPCGHMNRANARFCSICGEPTSPAGIK